MLHTQTILFIEACKKGMKMLIPKLPTCARNNHYAKMLLNFSQNCIREHLLKVQLILFRRLWTLLIVSPAVLLHCCTTLKARNQAFNPCILSYLSQKGWKASHYHFLCVFVYTETKLFLNFLFNKMVYLISSSPS